MKKLLFLLLISAGILGGCAKKESGPTTKTENPASTTINNKIVVDTSIFAYDGPWEFGQKIYFSRAGNVTKLGCKMGYKGSFRVSLWDFTTKNLIVATTVNVTDTTKFIYNAISSVAITANSRYVVSINTSDNGSSARAYYYYYKKSLPSTTSIYPFTTGSVTYESAQYAASATSTFPLSVDLRNAWYGIPDVQFEYTE